MQLLQRNADEGAVRGQDRVRVQFSQWQRGAQERLKALTSEFERRRDG